MRPRNPFNKQSPHMKTYYCTVHLINNGDVTFTVEAEDIRKAADKVREMYPKNMGFRITNYR